MLKKSLVLMLVVCAMGAVFAGCSSDDSSSSDFIGKWALSDAATSARTADISFNADGTLNMYEPGNPGVKAVGKYTVSGKTAKGDWDTHNGPNKGTLSATLTDSTHMDFLFGESKYNPTKYFNYKGVKVK